MSGDTIFKVAVVHEMSLECVEEPIVCLLKLFTLESFVVVLNSSVGASFFLKIERVVKHLESCVQIYDASCARLKSR